MKDSPSQLGLLNYMDQLEKQIGVVQKTIFLYDTYSEESIKSLQNLHAISLKILSPQIKINVNQERIKRITKYFQEVNEEDFLKNSNNEIRFIPYDSDGDLKYEKFKAIKVYTSIHKNETIRIVAIPVSKNIEANDGANMAKQLTTIQQEKYQATRSISDEGQRNIESAKFIVGKEKKQEQFNKKEERNHETIFKLESIISILAQKTKKISIGRLLEWQQTKLPDAISQMQKLFHYPKNIQPHYIYHLVDSEIDLKQSEDDACSPKVSTAFAYNLDNKQAVLLKGGRDQIFNDRYFTESKDFSTNIYKIRSENNAYMATAISKFVKNWSNIVKQAISPIEPVLKCIYQNLFTTKSLSTAKLPSANSLFPLSSKKKILDGVDKIYRYQEVFAMHGNLQVIKAKDRIEKKASYNIDFLQISKLYEEEVFQREQKEQKLSKQIEGITFLHYFSKANKTFLDNFKKAEKDKNQYSELIEIIEKFLIQIINLVGCVNDTLLSEQGFQKNRCKDLNKYAQFIKFILKQTILIDRITHLSVAVTSFIKSFFEGLLFADTWFFSYIMAKKESIVPKQSTKYYDLLIKFIQEDCLMEYRGKVQNIYLTIHKYKADKISQEIPKSIAKDYDQFKAGTIEAIKSYCVFVLGYDKLSQQNQNNTDKLTIEKKIARLLILIDQAEEAVKIYQRNHFVTKVDSCFKQIILSYFGEYRTSKLIEFGAYFENQFYYVEAKWYYQKAYDLAVSKECRRKAQICVSKCREHENNERKLDITLIKNYTERGGSEQDFLATNFGQIKNDVKLQSRTHYEALRDKRQWSNNLNKSSKSIQLSSMKEVL